MIRIPYQTLIATLSDILETRNFGSNRARLCARLFVDANRDGVPSHGLGRFASFLSMIDSGIIDAKAEPVCLWRGGSLERWDGLGGPGNLNAHFAMNRALELAEDNGVGAVALSNTNHWMRAGNYGWQAVEQGKMAMCWTNTMPNMPPWGAERPLTGNNPLVIAVPRESGHVVLDMAMSQFSYGALSEYRIRGEELPVPGGYDTHHQLTRDPAEIEKSGRPLPIGFWKGSGLSILLDLCAAMLSGGKASCDIPAESRGETELSQVFIAFSVPEHPGLADRVIQYLHKDNARGSTVRYPGERSLKIREKSMLEGVPVNEARWKDIQKMSEKN